jgi:hypothetical protein
VPVCRAGASVCRIIPDLRDESVRTMTAGHGNDAWPRHVWRFRPPPPGILRQRWSSMDDRASGEPEISRQARDDGTKAVRLLGCAA